MIGATTSHRRITLVAKRQRKADTHQTEAVDYVQQQIDNPGIPTITAARLLQVFCVLVLLLCNAAMGDTITIYHFNPESHSDRNLILKNTFDLYFQARYNIQLQPVEDQGSFEQLITSGGHNLFIMSHWRYHQLVKAHPDLTPRLQGIKDGKNTFRKLLIGKQPLPKGRMTIAVSGTERYVQTLLQQMSFNDSTLGSKPFRLLKVPKDIDALLAVSFGMADTALAADSSFEKLSLLYRNEFQQLEILGTSQPQQRLVVVVRNEHQQQLQTALEALETMDQSSEGKLGLNLLGLDEWTQINSTQAQGGRQR